VRLAREEPGERRDDLGARGLGHVDEDQRPEVEGEDQLGLRQRDDEQRLAGPDDGVVGEAGADVLEDEAGGVRIRLRGVNGGAGGRLGQNIALKTGSRISVPWPTPYWNISCCV
jgi:hypothetical protein